MDDNSALQFGVRLDGHKHFIIRLCCFEDPMLKPGEKQFGYKYGELLNRYSYQTIQGDFEGKIDLIEPDFLYG